MIKKIIFSPSTMLILMVLWVTAMAVATFVESRSGTAIARQAIYVAPWFWILGAAMVANFVGLSLNRRLIKQQKWGVLILHYGFAVIMAGAVTTHLMAHQGVVHIREGESSSALLNERGQQIRTLPFEIKLHDFRLERYQGSGSPSSYESDISIQGDHYQVYMNNIVYRDGYRIYQSSYDKDERGSILSLNYDTLGTTITYVGYLLLLIGMIMSLADRHSRLRTLARSLTILVLLLTLNSEAKSQGHDFARILVQTPEGRIEPMDTYTHKLLRKIARTSTFDGMDANRVILGMVADPASWASKPIIKTKDGYVNFLSVIDDKGNYRLASDVERIYATEPALRTKADKEILKLDEKVNILDALFNGQMLAIFPLEGTDRWYSPGDDLSNFSGSDSMFVSRIFNWYLSEMDNPTKAQEVGDMIRLYQEKKSTATAYEIEAEILYNRLDLFRWGGFGYMGIGLLFIIALIIHTVKPLNRGVFIGFSVVIGLLFLMQTFGMGLRWYIAERAPWTNSYESMIFIGWATALGGLIFARKSMITMALATFFAGIILFVSTLSWMDPEITPLVPVLKSPWLIVHVAVITSSYGFFGISFLLGVTTMILQLIGARSQRKELTVINEMSLIVGLCLMTAGTFLGAIWANESWGRYWGWDPKETWALITMVVYAAIIHSRMLRISDWLFNLLSILGLGAVLMTFFGVNYYLSGIHSYGADSAPEALWLIYVAYAIILVLSGVAYFKNDKLAGK